MMITIRREGDEWAEGIDTSKELVRECTLSAPEILARIKEAGIVGMGGAAFPTQVKLTVPAGKKVEHLIINGVECEPYLTSDHRVMLERSEELLVGVTILMRALGVSGASVGIENNKPDAITRLSRLASSYPGIRVVPLRVRYPQGRKTVDSGRYGSGRFRRRRDYRSTWVPSSAMFRRRWPCTMRCRRTNL